MNGVLVAFAVSFGVVFVAELGDKSQLMALTFATRFSALPVLVGLDAWHGRRRRADQPGVTGTVDRALNHHLAGWIALALGLVAVGPGTLGRHRMRRVGAVRRPVGPAGARPARGLFGLAVLLGLGAPLLVATDVVQPVALFDRPRWVAAGAAVLLLGTVMLLSAQVQRVALQQRGTHPVPATRGIHSRVRNPGLTGIVVVTAGPLLTVPTLLGCSPRS